MSVIAEFMLGEETFALGSATAGATDVTIELDRIAPDTSPGAPYLWVTGDDFEEFERVVRRSELIEELTLVDRTGDSTLYRIEWVPDGASLLRELAGGNVVLLRAYREGTRWFLRLRFDHHDDLTAFHAFCSDRGIDHELTRVYPDADGQRRRTAFGLTRQQHDTLALAVERGYFGVPREVTLGELGEELGITQQAVSERVRRATDTILQTVLLGPSATPLPEPGS